MDEGTLPGGCNFLPKVTQFVEDSGIEFMSSVSFHHHKMLRNETPLAWHSPLCMGLPRLVSGIDTHKPAQSPYTAEPWDVNSPRFGSGCSLLTQKGKERLCSASRKDAGHH